MRQKVLLKVARFMQRKSECACAAVSSLANYYDSSIKYKDVRKAIDPIYSKEGMHSFDIGGLLNSLGYKCVTIVSADTTIFDFTWEKHTVKWKAKRLKALREYYRRSSSYSSSDANFVTSYINFLETEGCSNSLVIDYDFPKYIKSSLRKGNPVIASINYTSYFQMPREHNDDWDDIKGIAEEHAFVIRGFDKESIYVVDSQGRKTDKYNGYYKIKWEHFLVNIGSGDLILVN